MIEFKVIRKNPVTGKSEEEYELFETAEHAKRYADADPNVTVDFDSMIDWDHSEEKYEYEC